MRRWTLGSLALLLTLSVLMPAPVRAETDPAEWAPADALLYVGIGDVDRLWEDFKKTASYALLSDPELAKAGGEFNAAAIVQKLKDRVAALLGIPAAQLRNPFKGPLALYAEVPRGGKSDDLQPGLVAGVGDAETMKNYYDALVTKLKERARHETVSAGSANIDVFTSEKKEAAAEEEDEFGDFDEEGLGGLGQSPEEMIEEALDEIFDPDALPPSLALCLTADRLIVAGTADQVRAVLRRESASNTLAETEDYKALCRHLRPLGDVRMLFNVPGILEVAKAEASGDEADEMRQVLQIIGAESLRSAVGHIRLGGSSYDTKLDMLFLMSGQRSGLAEILSMKNRETSPPPTIDANTCMYLGLNLDVPGLLDQVERMLRQTDPDAADQMRQALRSSMTGPEGEPIDMQEALLQHLQPPITMNLSITPPLGPQAVRMIIALGHKNQDALTRLLNKFVGMLSPREVRGTQVFDVVFPLPGLAGNALAPTSDRLVFASAASIETALEPRAGEPLAQSPVWQRAARFVPEESWLTVFIDSRRLTEAAAEIARNENVLLGSTDLGALWLTQMYGPVVAGMQAGGDAGVRKMIDKAAPQVITVTTTPEGVRLTSVLLNPNE